MSYFLQLMYYYGNFYILINMVLSLQPCSPYDRHLVVSLDKQLNTEFPNIFVSWNPYGSLMKQAFGTHLWMMVLNAQNKNT